MFIFVGCLFRQTVGIHIATNYGMTPLANELRSTAHIRDEYVVNHYTIGIIKFGRLPISKNMLSFRYYFVYESMTHTNRRLK
jgi:hypothetical protein